MAALKGPDFLSLALKMEEGGHELRDVNNLKEPEKVRKWILPWSLQREMQPCQHLDSSPVTTSDF